MEYIISDEHDGMLLRTYLRGVLGISRGELTSLKSKDMGIAINGEKVTVRATLKAGSVLSLDRDDAESSFGVTPVELPLDIIYEDDDIIALNKPPHMPTHPSHEHQNDTLANALAFYYSSKGIPFVFRAVNRLDRDTSGIVIVAKSRAAAFYMSEQISAFNVEKRYIAIAKGHIESPFQVEVYMKRQEESKMKRCVCDGSDGQYSLTDFDVISSNTVYSVLSVTPKTGRTHQIRLHLSYVGHPILSDTLYGDEAPSPLIDRQALHAHSLTFRRMSDSETVTLVAPPPPDMATLMKG